MRPTRLTLLSAAIALLSLLAAPGAAQARPDILGAGGESPSASHVCGCGPSCGCGASCGCADATVIADPVPPGTAEYAGPRGSSADVMLLSRISLPEFSTSVDNGNDCWGYVSPSGREYALMGLSNAVAFVEVTDPAKPVVVAQFPHPESLWADIKVHGHHAYVVNEEAGGLQVFDMSQIDDGFVSHVNTVTLNNSLRTTHNLAVDSASARLYLCGANFPTDGLVALSLANPVNPTLLGSYSATYVHDAHVVTFTEGPNAGRQIAFCFVGALGIDIVDVTNPAAMVRISRTTYSGVTYSHQGWLDAERNLLFMDDELDEGEGVAGNLTRIFDVSDLKAPFFVGSFSSGTDATDHNLYIRDNFVFASNYRAGLRIYDVSGAPNNVVEVGFFDTYPADDDVGFRGTWSNYPWLPSGNVIVSDIQGGLFMLDPTFALNGGVPLSFLVLGELPQTLEPVGSSIQILIQPQDGQSIVPGTARLFVDRGEGFEPFDMTETVPGLYRADFPALPCLEVVRYYFEAESSNGLIVHDPLSAPLGYYDAPVTTDTETVFDDNFESNQGWTVGAPGDDADTGVWVRAEPVGTTAQPDIDNPDGTGFLCFITGNGAVGGGLGDNDVDGGRTTLTSPVMDATSDAAQSQAMLVYYRWYSNDQGGDPFNDSMPVHISNDGGQTWTLLEEVSENAGLWIRKEFAIADFVEPTDQIRVRFVASDEGAGSIVEAGVDDVRIEIRECAGPTGDITGDGMVTFEDLNIVLGEFNQTGENLQGDITGDGAVDFEDLNIVLGNYGQSV